MLKFYQNFVAATLCRDHQDDTIHTMHHLNKHSWFEFHDCTVQRAHSLTPWNWRSPILKVPQLSSAKASQPSTTMLQNTTQTRHTTGKSKPWPTTRVWWQWQSAVSKSLGAKILTEKLIIAPEAHSSHYGKFTGHYQQSRFFHICTSKKC